MLQKGCAGLGFSRRGLAACRQQFIVGKRRGTCQLSERSALCSRKAGGGAVPSAGPALACRLLAAPASAHQHLHLLTAPLRGGPNPPLL